MRRNVLNRSKDSVFHFQICFNVFNARISLKNHTRTPIHHWAIKNKIAATPHKIVQEKIALKRNLRLNEF